VVPGRRIRCANAGPARTAAESHPSMQHATGVLSNHSCRRYCPRSNASQPLKLTRAHTHTHTHRRAQAHMRAHTNTSALMYAQTRHCDIQSLTPSPLSITLSCHLLPCAVPLSALRLPSGRPCFTSAVNTQPLISSTSISYSSSSSTSSSSTSSSGSSNSSSSTSAGSQSALRDIWGALMGTPRGTHAAL
jgi:hypothetical protein